MPAGRPTDYCEEFCERVITLGKEGASLVEMACDLGVTRQTLHNWKATHPEFLDAITRATDEAQTWWEKKGRDSLTTAGFQSSVWSRSMAARFPDDWREKSEINHNLTGELAEIIAGRRARVSEMNDGQ